MNEFKIDSNDLLTESQGSKNGLGAVAWATLEIFKRGGMPENDIKEIQGQMMEYFGNPSNTECNTVLRVVEKRLNDDKESEGIWYS
jgi:hypothetical protein